MKAIRFHQHGPSDVLAHEETDRPAAGPGQVVVKVAGTSFNPVDATIRAGYLREVFPVVFPGIPGIDVSGTVAELGADVTGWAVGDPVVALLPMSGGAAAEYVAVPADLLARAPHSVDLADAAALPAVGLTAYQALFEHAALTAGDTVLINGGGGAVGGYAVQLAAGHGATVTATAGPGSAARVRDHGAAEVIDYTRTPLAEAVAGRRFDVILNLAPTGSEETAALAELVADGGVLVSTTGPVPEGVGRGVRAVRMFVRSDTAQLTDLAARVDAGTLRIHVAARRPLTDLAAVHDEAVTGRLPGKTILYPA
ncbi:NADP-dependent oxidoreductase [Herbidospora sp. NBRC 101105]|uniref:NADP-dependent oxidoreductase n=1 Tax=Herbidospora sp. NBRC 101105 TaxID=3032195 RepID=UPI0024A3B931|nr:NADP-dependent oxidoreductase [Herbidospora sp. NBRC 101105]GLX94581.1 NADPH:quinone reductase [Herbidospora sp. NBRC 101105]